MTEYRLSFGAAAAHLVDVEIELEATAPIVLWMPAWTPGSYLIREFARNLRAVRAESDGAPLEVRRRDKATFEVEAPRGSRVVVRYRVYAFELSVRTSYVADDFALLNGASIFLAIAGREHERSRVELALPAGWSVVTGLPRDERGGFVAASHEALVDGPILAGKLDETSFEVEGIRHRIAVGGGGNHDLATLAAETKAIVEAASRGFGPLPYADYAFLLYTQREGQGGLEHRNSCVVAHPRHGFRDAKGRHDLLGLLAHEHFHVWNVKRTRPREFAPYDLKSENFTRALWICEGVTSYFDELLPRRAGLVTREAFLARLSEEITRYRGNPGRLEETLEESSLTTWIRFYRQDEDYPNSGVSYYQKGALVALCLDAAIREASGDRAALDDVMRALFARHPDGSPGYTTEEFEALAAEIAGADLREFFATALRSTRELDLETALARFGLRLVARPRQPAPTVRDWIGARLPAGGTARVDTVERGSPAAAAGLSPRDELLAFDGIRVEAKTFAERLAERAGGRAVPLAVFRDDRLLTLSLDLPAAPSAAWFVEVDEQASAPCVARRDAWLAAEGED
jgi:predicted metalloprotease with PDZ domain